MKISDIVLVKTIVLFICYMPFPLHQPSDGRTHNYFKAWQPPFYDHYTGQPALVSNHRLNIDHVHIAQAFCRNVFLLGCCSRSSWIFLATVSNSWVLPWQFASLSSGEWQFLHTQIFYKAVYTATCLKKYQIFNYQFTENLMLSLLVK